ASPASSNAPSTADIAVHAPASIEYSAEAMSEPPVATSERSAVRVTASLTGAGLGVASTFETTGGAVSSGSKSYVVVTELTVAANPSAYPTKSFHGAPPDPCPACR